MFQHPGASFPIRRDRLTRSDLVSDGRRAINLFGLADALKPGLERPVKALFVYNANPVTASADQNGIIEGLKRDDLFTVVSEIFPTDATDYADIVLPATSQLEQWDLMYSWGHLNLQLNQPAIPPRGESVSNTELFRRLSACMGFDDPDLQRSDEALMQDALDWDADRLQGVTLETLKRDGYARLAVEAPDRRTPHDRGAFPTPSGKCEFVSSVADDGGAILDVYRQGWTGGNDRGAVDPLPDWREAPASGDHPFTLLSPKTHHFLNSGYANLNAGSDMQPVWIHPEDAADNGIADGAPVRVFNNQGEVIGKARVTDDTVKGVVVITHGYWRKHVGGATVNALVAHKPAKIGCAPTINNARVDVAPA